MMITSYWFIYTTSVLVKRLMIIKGEHLSLLLVILLSGLARRFLTYVLGLTHSSLITLVETFCVQLTCVCTFTIVSAIS